MTRPPCGDAAAGGEGGARRYELEVHNLIGRPLRLVGPCQPFLRRVPHGRLLAVAPLLRPAQAPSPPAALAAFECSAALGDLLEFTLAYAGDSCEGFTVRVHAHARSPLSSDAVAAGSQLEVVSRLVEVPRLAARPPHGYVETALGVYARPSRDEAARVGELRLDQEVLAASGARQGRWLQITAPFAGWVQAEARDGSPFLAAPDGGGAPHLRQVVELRPAASAQSKPAAAPPPSAARQADREVHPAPCARASESEYARIRAAEAARLGQANALVGGAGHVGRGRRTMRGIH